MVTFPESIPFCDYTGVQYPTGDDGFDLFFMFLEIGIDQLMRIVLSW
ncbi:hypothetical protein [Ktedonosporobacter rubrisoli]|nr:hypothetical protein [Ktedonosporobacter rubrisoli]